MYIPKFFKNAFQYGIAHKHCLNSKPKTDHLLYLDIGLLLHVNILDSSKASTQQQRTFNHITYLVPLFVNSTKNFL